MGARIVSRLRKTARRLGCLSIRVDYKSAAQSVGIIHASRNQYSVGIGF